jgi:hypothetical protein
MIAQLVPLQSHLYIQSFHGSKCNGEQSDIYNTFLHETYGEFKLNNLCNKLLTGSQQFLVQTCWQGPLQCTMQAILAQFCCMKLLAVAKPIGQQSKTTRSRFHHRPTLAHFLDAGQFVSEQFLHMLVVD